MTQDEIDKLIGPRPVTCGGSGQLAVCTAAAMCLHCGNTVRTQHGRLMLHVVMPIPDFVHECL